MTSIRAKANHLQVAALSSSPLHPRSLSIPRIGFLGVGWIGRNRMEAIAAQKIAEIICIADASPQTAEQCQHCAPQAVIASSLDEALAHSLDGLVIATPSALHAQQAIAALEQDVAVFCQKPLGRNASEAQAVVDAAERADLLLGVDLSYRFVNGAVKIHDMIQSGELGDIYALDLVFHNAYGPDKPWFYDPKLSGGGCVMDLGIHLVDLALWLLDFPHVENVTARLFSQGQPLRDRSVQVEDYAEAILDVSSGAAVRLACSWKLAAGCDAVIQANIYGTKGGAALRNVNGSFYDFVAQHFRGTKSQVLAQPPDDWPGRAAAQWAQQLANGAQFDPEIHSVVTVANVLDAMYGHSP